MSVKVSPKYQVVIPEPIRSALGIKPGTIVEVIAKGKVAYIVPLRSVEELRTELAGKITQENLRDKKDRNV